MFIALCYFLKKQIFQIEYTVVPPERKHRQCLLVESQ